MTDPLSHARASELLPWLVNGTLAAEERDAVEQHVRDCLPCRRELKEQQRLYAAVRAQPAVHLSPQSSFERLLQQLDGKAALPPVTPASRTAPFLRFAGVAAAGVTLVAMLSWLVLPSTDRGPADYETLATQPGERSREIDLIFLQSATAGDIQALLDEIGGTIAAGPTELGRYTVRLESTELTDAEVAALVTRLASDPRVRFAGRGLTEGPAP
jgi:hypothetical protein